MLVNNIDLQNHLKLSLVLSEQLQFLDRQTKYKMGDLIKPKPIFMQEITGSTLFPNIQDTYYNVILFNLPIQLGIQKRSQQREHSCRRW